MLRAAQTTAKTDTGRQRRDNEDSAFARSPLFVVADGMGGAQAGEVASRMAVEAFQRELSQQGSPEERLADRAKDANRRIYEISSSEHERAGMGTTLTAAYLDDANLAIAHVGDSRAYLFRDASLSRLTQDHSLVGELVRRGKLTEEQAAEHPQRSIITRALGVDPEVQVDTWTYPARAGDVVLLCSDGLTSMISEEQIAAILSEESDLDQAAERLIAEANEAGGRDNITVVIFRLEDAGGESRGDAPTVVGLEPAQTPAGEPTAPAASAPAASAPAARDRAASDRAARARPGRTAGATMTAPPPSAGAPRTAPARSSPRLARTQGRSSRPPGGGRTRRPRRFAKPVAALVAVVVVLFLVGGGGYLASRQLFFVGTNPQGVVTVYRGFPYDLPLGIRLYEQVYVSGVPVQDVPAARRKNLLNHQLRSQADAIGLARAAELGQLTR
ncbi:MAG TPA: Stp1/IreP family PP2C-type Ser/Thr phosphatase [Solirubrobacteraceae bacterium]|jgi:protein phosphatase